MKQLPPVAVASKYWAFRGGLNLVTPPLSMPPGYCRAASNVEIGIEGGLTVTQGYERFDGQPKPSDATYTVVAATITGSWALGNTLTGNTSGATGVIIAVVTTVPAYFVVTKVVGAFVSGEALKIGGVTIATATADGVQGSASTPALDASYKNLAADNYRADIAAVPGSGDILGAWKYDDNVYAIRNNAGATAAVMHKATVSGWSAISLGRELAFTSGGATEITAGQTITGATSGATAVLAKVVKTSGTWSGGTAAGYFYFTSQTGTFQAENINIGASPNLATISGDSAPITLEPDGRYEFINTNFGGASGTEKMYGASGTHRAFEFDGTNFAFITTGMVVDKPTHIIAHKLQLFLSFDASVQHSGPTDPFAFTIVQGDGEIATGQNVTNFIIAPGGTTAGALTITTRNKTLVLYGNDPTDWNLVTWNPDAGAIGYTGQYAAGRQVWLDDRGISDMQTSQTFGNFRGSDLSALIVPTVKALRASAISSCVVREKNQYRLFFSGGDALYATFVGGKVAGIMPITLANPALCICSLEANDGVEETFFGSSNGFVYQMDRGTSQDGEVITWSCDLAFNHFGSPRQLKTFRKAVVEISGSGYCEFQIGYSLAYGSTDLPAGRSTSITTALSATAWDSFIWDQFFWDGQTLTPSEADLDGTGENLSVSFSGSSDQFQPITLNGAIVDFTPRRQLR
jgi:hypothetical protein